MSGILTFFATVPSFVFDAWTTVTFGNSAVGWVYAALLVTVLVIAFLRGRSR